MTTAAQPYHHGNLRPVLVDTAVELARSTGPDGVVLREVARRAGVSHNAAYRHFSDRAALLAEVSDRAYADLERAMLDRIATVTEEDPSRRAVRPAARDRPGVRRLRDPRAGPVHGRVHRAGERGRPPPTPTS